ncbi:sodium-coupled monocarboxylate transporter 2-like isoform X2 [Phymastichus coffea]|uniref:sodium-coupled monocarboxylate transporter 2-like isoform X2 n=1 Tax=Phymastichus coffea TaxID=108790 RepID=UPI00273BA63C|nr:sodium-coupled monocarboxylate transporter 2-like isoform X2 [Phymastichus coffea]
MDPRSSTVLTIIQEMPQLTFGWTDYTLFAGLLGMSLIIGFYFGFFSKQDSASEYLFGGKSYPTEVYYHGAMMIISMGTAVITMLTTVHIFLPVFYNLQIVSSYEYLEMRFSRKHRQLASLLYTISLLLYIPIVVYVPSLVFAQVTGYGVHLIAPIFSFVCITYTSMGGVKAVVWTDTIQFIFTLGGFFTILIIGINYVGGVSRAFEIASEGRRLEIIDFDPSPLKRYSFWGMTLGMYFSSLSRYTIAQKFVQRFLTIKQEQDVKKAAYLTGAGVIFLQSCCILYGLLVYATYHNCDPLTTHLIKQADQIVPYYVMDIVGHIPGLPGIFLAGLVSSALSTMSASLNCLSGMIYEDFLDGWIADSPKKDAKSANIMKFLSVMIGLITVALIFLIERLGTIFEMSQTLSTAVDGPLLSFFILGILVPWVGKKGAITGGCASIVFMTWLLGGMQWHIFHKRIVTSNLPLSTQNCSFPFNESVNADVYQTTPISTITSEDEPWIIFRISMLFLHLIGTTVAIIVAVLTSIITKETNMTDVDPRHVSPLVRRFLPDKKYTEVPLKEIKKEKD